MNPATYSIFFHNYYGQHADWIDFFSAIKGPRFDLFYNLAGDSIFNLDAGTHLPAVPPNDGEQSPLRKLVFRRSPNQGKDIGGKLVLLDAFIKSGQQSDYIVFLHDKKSPYKIQNQEWQKSLFRIIEPAFIEKAIGIFEKDKKAGIIATENAVKNEFDFSTNAFSSNNRAKLIELQSQFHIHTTDYRYVAGTMFWVRTAPLLAFFEKNPPLEIRKTLEKGNVMDEITGTNTHSWERLLSWLILSQAYNIKTIR